MYVHMHACVLLSYLAFCKYALSFPRCEDYDGRAVNKLTHSRLNNTTREYSVLHMRSKVLTD